MKINLIRIVFFCALLLLAAHIATADGPDVALRNKIVFNLQKTSDGSYYLASRVETQHSFISARSMRDNHITIFEPYWAKVSNLKATFRGKPLKNKYHSTQLAEFKDIFISLDKVHTLHFPVDIHEGDTAVISYKQNYDDIALLPIITIPNIDYVKGYQAVFNHPETVQVDFEIFFSRKSIDYEIDRANPMMTTLTFNRIDYQKNLACFPHNDFHAAVLVTVSENGNPVSPVEPEHFVDWYGKEVDLAPTFNHELGDALSEKFSNVSAPLEKLEILYNYVRKNVRYIADYRYRNSFTPRDPIPTFETGYGDCKDKAYLISALARRYGMEVDMALLAVEPTPAFKGLHVAEFDHVICAYDDGQKMVYFDPTARHCEFGNLPEGDIGRRVLILNPAKPGFDTIPVPNHCPSIDITISGNLSEPGNGAAVVVLRNEAFHQAVQAKAESSGVELNNMLSQIITAHLYKISLEQFQVMAEDDSSLTLHAKADLSRFIISSATRKYIPKTAFLVVSKDILSRQADDYPIELPFRHHLKMTIDLDAAGYAAGDDRCKLGKEGDMYFSSSATHKDAHRLTLFYDYRQPMKKFELETKDRFVQFCAKYLKHKKEMFVLRSTVL